MARRQWRQENHLDVAETVDLEVVRIPDQAMASVSSHDLVRVPLKWKSGGGMKENV